MLRLIQKSPDDKIIGYEYRVELDGRTIATTWGHITTRKQPDYDGGKWFVAINGTETFYHGIDEIIQK
jgi:hypothetical protein